MTMKGPSRLRHELSQLEADTLDSIKEVLEIKGIVSADEITLPPWCIQFAQVEQIRLSSHGEPSFFCKQVDNEPDEGWRVLTIEECLGDNDVDLRDAIDILESLMKL